MREIDEETREGEAGLGSVETASAITANCIDPSGTSFGVCEALRAATRERNGMG